MTVTPIQILRKSALGVRPDPTALLQGQPAVNTNAEQPGLFFADSTNTDLIKIGPTSLGEDPPTPNPSLGESWIQPDGADPGIPMLWLFDGTSWRGVPLTETYVAPGP
jgi:hypothetical protein